MGSKLTLAQALAFGAQKGWHPYLPQMVKVGRNLPQTMAADHTIPPPAPLTFGRWLATFAR